jgi:hypothetical protein
MRVVFDALDRVNAGTIDRSYLERWAARLHVTERLRTVS